VLNSDTPPSNLQNTSGTGVPARRFFEVGPPAGPIQKSIDLYFPGWSFRPVQSLDEYKQAMHLVYREYCDAGLILPQPSEVRASPFHLVPSTRVFVALTPAPQRVAATLTLIEDSPMGLPMDKVYHEELNNLRLSDHRLVEFSMFAADKDITQVEMGFTIRQRQILLYHVFRSLFDYLRVETQATTQVECHHPAHDAFYAKLNGRGMGNMRFHAGVKGNPALARYFPFHELGQLDSSYAFKRLLYQEIDRAVPRHASWSFSEEAIEFFFVESSNGLGGLRPEIMRFLESCHPGINFNRLLKKRTIFDYVINCLDTRQYDLRASVEVAPQAE
jgi:hypothetical protein